MLSAFLADAKSTINARMNRDETGATAVEYGIMVALIAVVIIVAVTMLGGSIQDMFAEASCQINGGTLNAGTAAAGDTVCTP